MKEFWELLSPGSRIALKLVGIAFGFWAMVVALTGLGVNLTFFSDWNFERTAQLGDSFGVVSAIMAGAAALFTYDALQKERAEVIHLRAREEIRDLADANRETEATFFRFLDFRTSLLSSIFVESYESKWHGIDAIEIITNEIRTAVSEVTTISKSYNKRYLYYRNQLGHYFRFTYHIVKFADESFQEEKKYEYVRILRAQLSNSELIIIALNCSIGEGHSKFKPLVEKFSLLHNIDESDVQFFNLREHFSPTAFQRAAASALSDAATP